jgi:hypothetical protein
MENRLYTGEGARDGGSPIWPESTKTAQNAHIMPKKALFWPFAALPPFTEFFQNPVLWNNQYQFVSLMGYNWKCAYLKAIKVGTICRRHKKGVRDGYV